MREILFRGKRKDNGKWVYGSLLKQAGEYISKDEVAPIECWICGMRGEKALIVSETIGQYTGLKDVHGTMVFEGDIVKFDGYPEFYSYVCFENFAIMCKSKVYKQYGYYISNESWHKLEVIGNIYDNPGLVEGSV